MEKHSILNEEKIKELKDQLFVYNNHNGTFIKANREGKTQERKDIESNALHTEIEDMKEKIKKMDSITDTYTRAWQQKCISQIKWKMFIGCMMSKVYGRKSDPNKVINLMDVI